VYGSTSPLMCVFHFYIIHLCLPQAVNFCFDLLNTRKIVLNPYRTLLDYMRNKDVGEIAAIARRHKKESQLMWH
jgi:hypothetical protein